MCKSRDPFFDTGVFVRARCASYYLQLQKSSMTKKRSSGCD